MLTDHPLSWHFSKNRCSLYFNGRSANPAKLFSDMYLVHETIFEGYLPFETFFNKTGNLLQLISSGHGLLAAGPEDLLIRYTDCLVQHGVRYSFLGRKDATRDVLAKPALKTLLLGESYIVAEDFIFTQLD